jgi:hypothetical protein
MLKISKGILFKTIILNFHFIKIEIINILTDSYLKNV